MKNSIDLAEALNIFDALDSALGRQRPRLAARRTLMFLYYGIDYMKTNYVEDAVIIEKAKDK